LGIKHRCPDVTAESRLEGSSNAVAALRLDPESWQDIFLIRNKLASEVPYTRMSSDDFEGLF